MTQRIQTELNEQGKSYIFVATFSEA